MKLDMIRLRYTFDHLPGTMSAAPMWTKGEREVKHTVIELSRHWQEPCFCIASVKLIGHRIKKDGTPYNEVLDWNLYGKAEDEWLEFIGFDMDEAVRVLFDRIGDRP